LCCRFDSDNVGKGKPCRRPDSRRGTTTSTSLRSEYFARFVGCPHTRGRPH